MLDGMTTGSPANIQADFPEVLLIPRIASHAEDKHEEKECEHGGKCGCREYGKV
jgi:hypothetical protein